MTNQDSAKPAVIIIDLATLQGLHTARTFARLGVKVLAMTDDPGHFCCRTKVCTEVIVSPVKTSGLMDDLVSMGPTFDQPPVLIPCSDEAMLTLSRNRARLSGAYRFLLPDSDVVELLIDKGRFYQFASEHGFDVPKSFVVRNQADLEQAAKGLPFPCIVKPPQRSTSWLRHMGFKAFKVTARNELFALYEKSRACADTIVVQECISGPDSALFSCNCYLDAQGNPLATFVARKLRQWPPRTGESSLGQECRNDVVLNETLRLFASVGYRGLGYLELKHDALSGRHVIIEANVGRPTGRSAIIEAGGVEMLNTMYCDLVGLPLPQQRTQRYTGIKWVHLTRDCASAWHDWRRNGLTLRQWRSSLRGRKVFAVFSTRDPLPFVVDLLRLPKRLLTRSRRYCLQQERKNQAEAPKARRNAMTDHKLPAGGE